MRLSLIGLAAAGVAAAAFLATGFVGPADVRAGTVSAEGFAGFRLLDLDGHKVKWGRADGSRVIVTYAIVGEAMTFPSARNCGSLVPMDGLLAASGITRVTLEEEVRAAFAMWQQVAEIEFQKVSDPAAAGILIGAQAQPSGHAFANVDYRPGTGSTREIEKSLICLNPQKSWKVGFGGSLAVYDLRYTITHEIGHAIGLDHPDPAGQLMSFRYQEEFRALQAGDIEGAVQLYGGKPALTPAASKPAKPAGISGRQG